MLIEDFTTASLEGRHQADIMKVVARCIKTHVAVTEIFKARETKNAGFVRKKAAGQLSIHTTNARRPTTILGVRQGVATF